MAKASSELHVVMLPWSAFGHLIPFYQLATSLAKQGVRVSYISTPKNIERLPKIDLHLAHLLQYISLPLPVVPGNNLPQGAEATVDMELDQIQYLKVAYDLLYDHVKLFVSSHSPDWIISDFAAHWLPEIAQEYRVKLMLFSVFNATSMTFTGPPQYLTSEGQKRLRPTADSWTSPPHWGSGIYPPTVCYRSYEATHFHSGIYDNDASGTSTGERLCKVLQGCHAVGIRSCREFEGEYIDLYQTLLDKPVVPVGMLPATEVDETETEHISELWSETFKWLDQQKPRSVVYVGFGSETKLTKDEIYEIAYGLKLSKLPFIWTLRKPTWADKDVEALPPQFANQTSGKGMVCFGWAPQLKILSHPSVGGSLFHCGAASIVETLQHGHNLIMLPCVIEQGLNARLLVHKGLGIEVERREDGSFTCDDIADALRRGMIGDEAERIRARAKQAAKIFGDVKLHQEHYIGGLVEFMRNSAKNQ